MYDENAVLNNRIEEINESSLTYEKETFIRRFLTKQMIRIILLLLGGTMTNMYYILYHLLRRNMQERICLRGIETIQN